MGVCQSIKPPSQHSIGPRSGRLPHSPTLSVSQKCFVALFYLYTHAPEGRVVLAEEVEPFPHHGLDGPVLRGHVLPIGQHLPPGDNVCVLRLTATNQSQSVESVSQSVSQSVSRIQLQFMFRIVRPEEGKISVSKHSPQCVLELPHGFVANRHHGVEVALCRHGEAAPGRVVAES